MLPDYPRLKVDLSRRMVRFLQERRESHLGPLAHINRIMFLEGDAFKLRRSTGEEEPGAYQEASALITFKDDEIPTMMLESLLQRFDDAAQEMARQQAETVYGSIAEALEKAGSVVDAGGQRMSAQLILDALSNIQIDFNRDGSPRMPEMHVHPNLANAVLQAGEELERNPDLKRQLSQIREEKKEEWRAREASRKLVG